MSFDSLPNKINESSSKINCLLSQMYCFLGSHKSIGIKSKSRKGLLYWSWCKWFTYIYTSYYFSQLNIILLRSLFTYVPFLYRLLQVIYSLVLTLLTIKNCGIHELISQKNHRHKDQQIGLSITFVKSYPNQHVFTIALH